MTSVNAFIFDLPIPHGSPCDPKDSAVVRPTWTCNIPTVEDDRWRFPQLALTICPKRDETPFNLQILCFICGNIWVIHTAAQRGTDAKLVHHANLQLSRLGVADHSRYSGIINFTAKRLIIPSKSAVHNIDCFWRPHPGHVRLGQTAEPNLTWRFGDHWSWTRQRVGEKIWYADYDEESGRLLCIMDANKLLLLDFAYSTYPQSGITAHVFRI